MAAITLDTLRATIRFRGDYQNLRKFPNADVDKEIQASFGEYWQLIDEVHEGWWDKDGTVATTASTSYVALPTDCWRVKAVDWLDGTRYVPMVKTRFEHRNRFSGETGEPQGYRLSARGAELLPTPNAVYTLRVTYTPICPALSASQPREYYNGWEDYVITSTLCKLDEREGKGLERMSKLEAMVKMIKSGASGRDESGPEYLDLREGGYSGSPWHEGDY